MGVKRRSDPLVDRLRDGVAEFSPVTLMDARLVYVVSSNPGWRVRSAMEEKEPCSVRGTYSGSNDIGW